MLEAINVDNMKVLYVIFLSVAFVGAESPILPNQYLPTVKGFTYPSPQYSNIPAVTTLNYGVSGVTPNYIPPSSYGPPSTDYGQPFSGQPITVADISPNAQYGITVAAPKIYNRYEGPLIDPNINLPYGTRLTSKYGAPRFGNKYLRPYENYQREPANYNYGYDVQAPEYGTEFGHEEVRQGDVAQGRYYTLLPDGRRQIVEYTADENGYRPKISYQRVGYPQATAGYQY